MSSISNCVTPFLLLFFDVDDISKYSSETSESVQYEFSSASLYINGVKVASGKAALTQARFLWQPLNASEWISLLLRQIDGTAKHTPGSSLLRSKASISFRALPRQAALKNNVLEYSCPKCTLINPLSSRSCDACGLSLSETPTTPKLVPGEGQGAYHALVGLRMHRGADWLCQRLNRTLEEKLWQSLECVSDIRRPFGLHGIVAKHEEIQRSQKQSLDEAFSDLDTLMASAKKMVDFASSLSEKLCSEISADEVTQFRSSMMKLGVSIGQANSPNALIGGSSVLAFELSNFLDQSIQTGLCAGIISVADLYCMFNRSRASTGLVSPDELWEACRTLSSKYNAREYTRGLKVVHTEKFSDQLIFERFKQHLSTPASSLTDLKFAKDMGISIVYAEMLLNYGATSGLLVIDRVSNTYFSNIFWNALPKEK